MPGDDMEILGANNPTTTPNHPPKPNQPLVNQLEVLDLSHRLDLIDSQSSLLYTLQKLQSDLNECSRDDSDDPLKNNPG